MKLLPAAVLCSMLLLPPVAAQQTVVTKVVAPFDEATWSADRWSSAGGVVSLSDEVAGDVAPGGSMKVEVHFNGQGFNWFNVLPDAALVIPGEAKRITIRVKRSSDDYGMRMLLRDGWGREQDASGKLDWSLPFGPAGEWRIVTFEVPDSWVKPITIAGLNVHNWGKQNVSAQPVFWIDHLEVTTDLADVDPTSGLLTTWQAEEHPEDPAKALAAQPAVTMLELTISTGERSNIFSRKAPAFNISVMSWKAEELSGTVSYTVSDADGAVVAEKQLPITVAGATNLTVPLAIDRYGIYQLAAAVELSDGSSRSEQLALAYIPAWRDLSEQQKLDSPYGINVHGGGGDKLAIDQFKKAGVVWFRDYAWNFDWLRRARGADGQYTGWPNFQQLVQKYVDAEVMLLPCLQQAMRIPEMTDGEVTGPIGPDTEWMRRLADVLLKFSQPLCWELDNEYDLHQSQVGHPEDRIDWRNYGLFHQRFAELVKILGGDRLMAVEQGQAGIWPDRVRQMVREGYFDQIGAVNTHHYCGVEAPEVNYGNFNTGFGGGGQQPMLFFDRLRETTRAATADGKARQHWLTEFGWDTLAGQVVSDYQQAVYLPRSWMISTAAGADKSFWFFDYDSPNPTGFFGGCGLLRANAEPKPALCSLAGMTSILYAPKLVGDINAGPGTAGFVFENDGELIASLWNIADDDGPTVTFQAERMYEYFGNELDTQTVKLTMAPVYAAGLTREDPLFAQTAYSLDTPGLVVATAGDPVRPVVQVRNNRNEPIRARITLSLPEGWTPAGEGSATADTAPGAVQFVAMPFYVDLGEHLGMKEVTLTVSEGDRQIKQMPLKVLVRRPLAMEVGALRGAPGRTEIDVRLGNRSIRPVAGTLSMSLPGSWNAVTAPAEMTLDSGQDVQTTLALEWNTDWQADEAAQVIFDAGEGRRIARSIIPNRLRIPRADGLDLDGDLSDWAAAAELPAWILGSSMGEADARVLLAWAPEGLYCAVEAHDSRVLATDPRSFWQGDVLELFIDTAASKTPRAYGAGDHQFWLVPQVDENRVYMGQWAHGEGQEARYDLPIRSAARRTEDGYVLEFLVPAEQLVDYEPAVGEQIGFNVNVTIKGERFDREVYWPRVKDEQVCLHPESWGTVELGE